MCEGIVVGVYARGPEGAARRGAPEGFLLLLCEAVRVDRASRRVDHTGGVSAKWRWSVRPVHFTDRTGIASPSVRLRIGITARATLRARPTRRRHRAYAGSYHPLSILSLNETLPVSRVLTRLLKRNTGSSWLRPRPARGHGGRSRTSRPTAPARPGSPRTTPLGALTELSLRERTKFGFLSPRRRDRSLPRART